MAAPTPSPRLVPTGQFLKNGYRSLITIANAPHIALWEKGVQPPGLDGGEPVDTTTMHNRDYRSSAPRSLKTLTAVTFKAAYDPAVYPDLVAQINVEQVFTNLFSNHDSLCYWGFLQKVEPQEMVDGTQPEANVTIMPTNVDPSDGSEAGPVWTAATGTGTGV